MNPRLIGVVVALALFAGCRDSENKPNKAAGQGTNQQQPNSDAAFQAFLAQLRKAVIKRDIRAMAGLMVPDFGYRWDEVPPGETPFDYWSQRNLWNELSSIVKDRWVAHDGFMVAPPQLASGGDYNGYRAGAKMMGGEWRLVYFVPAPPPSE